MERMPRTPSSLRQRIAQVALSAVVGVGTVLGITELANGSEPVRPVDPTEQESPAPSPTEAPAVAETPEPKAEDLVPIDNTTTTLLTGDQVPVEVDTAATQERNPDGTPAPVEVSGADEIPVRTGDLAPNEAVIIPGEQPVAEVNPNYDPNQPTG